MTSLPRQLPIAWRPLVVLVVSLALTAGATYFTTTAARAADVARFQSTSRHLEALVRGRLDAYTTMLEAGSALAESRPALGRAEFDRYVDGLHLQSRYPGILGVGYSVRVRPEALDSLVRARRAADDPTFHVWPDSARPEYHTIIYIQPLGRRNRAAVGYDMFTQPTRRAAMERARDSGAPAASGRVTLVQEIDARKQPGFLIYVPVYDGRPANTIERRSMLRGFFYAAFRAGDLFHAILDGNGSPQVDVRIYAAAVPAPEALLYDSSPGADSGAAGGLAASIPLAAAGARWTMTVRALPPFLAAGDRGVARVVLAGGIVMTLLLFGIALSESRALARAVRDVAARQAAEHELRESEARFRSLFHNHPDAVFSLDLEGHFVSANRGCQRISGYSPEELLGRSFIPLVAPDVLEAARAQFARARAGEPRHFTSTIIHKSGRRVDIDATNVPVVVNEEIVGVFGIVKDVTEQRHLEAQLRQTQRMEAVGLLAGGIAHDFNNLLTAIKGNVEFLLEGCPVCEARLEEAVDIAAAADRAAALTGQLLAFSRRQMVRPREVDVDALVAQLERMLARLVPESIQQELVLGARSAHVRIDPGQLEQVVINLVVNARDAMPTGGHLVIRTGRQELAAGASRRFGGAVVRRGKYFHLAVLDSGCGMDAATKEHAFEPFFTTKPVGQGTGLGLSTVYGIVKQNGGYIAIDSAPGVGTTVDVYLPLVPAPAEPAHAEQPRRAAPGGTETILVVEDEAAIRSLVERVLSARGYTVLAVPDGASALHVAERHDGPIDLLVTDVIMPGMSGPELEERLGAVRGAVPVLYVSGYADEHVARLGEGAELLEKPFTTRELLERVRGILSGNRESGIERRGRGTRTAGTRDSGLGTRREGGE